MKRIIPLLLLPLTLLLSSCLDTQSHYTPEVALSSFVTSEGDTLLYFFDSTSNLWHVDSLLVGDTATFAVGYAGLGTNIISTHLAWDTAYLDIWTKYSSEMKNILLPQSDTTKLSLYFPTGYNYIGLPIWLTPKKAGSTALKFTVITDSKYSPAEENLILNIIKE